MGVIADRLFLTDRYPLGKCGTPTGRGRGLDSTRRDD